MFLLFVCLVFAAYAAATTPWIDPYVVRCIQNGDMSTFSNPCNLTGFEMNWTSIETQLITGQPLSFAIHMSLQSSEPVQVSGFFVVCLDSAYDCNPLRNSTTANMFRLPRIPFVTNHSDVSFRLSTPFADSHTFVAAVQVSNVLYYIGVSREVMSGFAFGNPNILESTCLFQLLGSSNQVNLRIDRNTIGPGLSFGIINFDSFPVGGSYFIRVHKTGDTRSFSNALGYFIGSSLDASKLFEVGVISYANFVLNSGLQQFVDYELNFTGINGILGRSLILHNTNDNSRVAQCLVKPYSIKEEYPDDPPPYDPIPDYDATICVFSIGDIVQLETSDKFSKTPTIFIRYAFQFVSIVNDTIPLIHSETKSVLLSVSSGPNSGTSVWTPGFLWYMLPIGSTLSFGTDYCIISRLDHSGVFYQREYPQVAGISSGNNNAVGPLVTSASCILQADDVAGQVVFTLVSGSSALCTPQATNCVRVDYFFPGLTVPSNLMFRQYGVSGSSVFVGYSSPPSCGNTANCVTGISAPLTTIPLVASNPSETISGVYFTSLIALNGVNSIIGRSVSLQALSSQTVSGECVIGVDSFSQTFKASASSILEDNPDQAICEFSPADMLTGQVTFKNLQNGGVQATITLHMDVDIDVGSDLILDFVTLQTSQLSMPLPTIRTTIQTAILVNTTQVFTNIGSVSILFGKRLGLYSSNGVLTTGTIGLNYPTVIPSSSPTPMPTPKTRSPTAPVAINPNSSITAGGVLVLAVLIIVVAGFFCILCTGICRRVYGYYTKRRQYEHASGIGEEWDFEIELNDQRNQLKQPSSSDADEEDDDEMFGNIEGDRGHRSKIPTHEDL